ncbi:unnamed protein product [Rotaria sp. Silwood2]|nr:unnamed protein product [Rotaria sp. Silwood2]
MLASQCLYSFDVDWSVTTVVSLRQTSKILSETFQQLKSPIPIELQLRLEEDMYSIRAVTIPRMDKYLSVYCYLRQNTVHGRHVNIQSFSCNEIIMRACSDEINDEFLHFSPPLVHWNQVTSLDISQPFNSNHLHLLFSKLINLRTFELHYTSKYDDNNLNENIFIDLLNDTSLCNMLMSNGLRQLNLFTIWKQSNLLDIAYLIVDRLLDLKIIKLNGYDDKLIEVSHIFINGLSKLSFLTITGCYKHGKLYDIRLRDL